MPWRALRSRRRWYALCTVADGHHADTAARFRHTVDTSKAIERTCIRYNEVLLSQARVTAGCNALHPVDTRFCRWLLQSADRAESTTVALTQELLSEMLGVRRTSVTEVAG